MEQETLGKMIASLRKEHGMTQLELAEKMGVTDKAVSKWERDLSCPDVGTLPKLAGLFGVTVDDLMRGRPTRRHRGAEELVPLVCSGVALAMGVSVTVLAVLRDLDLYAGFSMLGIGLTCVGVLCIQRREKD